MATVKVLVIAEAVIEVEEECFDGYSANDLLEAADNSKSGWQLVDVKYPELTP